MKYLLSRLDFRAKTNKKKSPGFLLISSNSTFYITFVLSLVFHAGLIYTIPAVNVFSEGQNEASLEPIVVDFVQEDFSDLATDMSPPDLEQFNANTPETSNDYAEELLPQQFEVVKDIDIDLMPLEKLTSMDNDYVLLSQAVTKEPELTSLTPQKRSLQKVPAQVHEADKPRSDKLMIQQKDLEIPLIQSPQEIEQLVKISPIHNAKSHPNREEIEQALQFPHVLQNTEERQSAISDRLLKRSLDLEKRLPTTTQKTEPTMLSKLNPVSSLSQKRKFGITREDETDTNRFGIFAGKPFDASIAKEETQELSGQKEEEQAPSDATETAKALQASSDIEGPIKGRTLIHRPRPPQLANINIDVDLQLKFWVLPDGTIGEVIPIKRGNAELERIAIAYLKEWKFEALPEGAEQRQIWGTIPIKFTIQ